MDRPDRKIIKKHYPRENLDERLSFTFEADPNLCLVKNKIQIFFTIEVDEKYVPENGFAAKQFSCIDVELNSMLVSTTKTRGQYYMNDWLLKKINFTRDNLYSMFRIEGYFDDYNYEDLADDDKIKIAKTRRSGCLLKDKKYIYQLCMIPTDAFLLDNKPLPPNLEMKLTLNRQNKKFSCINTGEADLFPAPFVLKDCYANVEYISSSNLRQYLDPKRPISYKYDELKMITRVLPRGERRLRIENLAGGNTPEYLFVGLIETGLLGGDDKKESINFLQHGAIQFDLLLNGSSCNGYPMVSLNRVFLFYFFRQFNLNTR